MTCLFLVRKANKCLKERVCDMHTKDLMCVNRVHIKKYNRFPNCCSHHSAALIISLLYTY